MAALNKENQALKGKVAESERYDTDKQYFTKDKHTHATPEKCKSSEFRPLEQKIHKDDERSRNNEEKVNRPQPQ